MERHGRKGVGEEVFFAPDDIFQLQAVATCSQGDEILRISIEDNAFPRGIMIDYGRFQRIVGRSGAEAEGGTGRRSVFRCTGEVELAVAQGNLNIGKGIVPTPFGSQAIGGEIVGKIGGRLLYTPVQRCGLDAVCIFPGREIRPFVFTHPNFLQERLSPLEEALVGQIGVAQVEEAAVGSGGDGAVSDGKDVATAVEDGIPVVFLVRSPKILGAGDGNRIIAAGTATAAGGIDEVIVIAVFEPLLALHADAFVVAEEGERLAHGAQAVVGELAGKEFYRTVIQSVGFPRDIELELSAIFQDESIDSFSTEFDDRAVVFEFPGRGISYRDTDARDAVSFLPRCIVNVDFPLVDKPFRRPERRDSPVGELRKDMTGGLPVHEVGRRENRVVRSPFGGSTDSVIRISEADNGRVGHISPDDGIDEIRFFLGKARGVCSQGEDEEK